MRKGRETATTKISDLYLAAFLLVSEVPLLRVEKDPNSRHRKFFVFENSPIVEELRHTYFNDTAVKFKPKSYAHAVRDLKVRVMS